MYKFKNLNKKCKLTIRGIGDMSIRPKIQAPWKEEVYAHVSNIEGHLPRLSNNYYVTFSDHHVSHTSKSRYTKNQAIQKGLTWLKSKGVC